MPGDYAAPCWLLRQARQLLYPRRCPFCRRVLGFVPTCPECAERLEPLRRMPMRLKESEHYLGTLSGAAAPYRYTGCVRSAVLRAKYQGEPWTAVEPTPQRVEGLSLGYDAIVPVPASGKKRGYNVPERMARPLAKAVGVPLAANALGRARTGRHQAGLSLDERLVNVAGAFRVLEPDNVDGKRVLLVDDVITTGATAAACAQALLDAGAQSVFAVALATVEFDALPSRSQPIAETAEEDEKEIEKT